MNCLEFDQLFFHLSRAFAEALSCNWNEQDARTEWARWVTANPLPPDLLTIRVNGAGLIDRYGEFDVVSGEITLDTSLLSSNHDPNNAARVQFLLFVKCLHEVAHSLTALILRFLKHLYRNESRQQKGPFPTKNTPVKVGTISAKKKGRLRISLEQILSGNLRFSFEHARKSVNVVRRYSYLGKRKDGILCSRQRHRLGN